MAWKFQRGKRVLIAPYRSLFLMAIGLVSLAGCIGQEPNSPILVAAIEMANQPVVVRNVAVFDSESLQVIPHQNVRISGTVITAIEPYKEGEVIDDAQIVEGEGATLLPGLIDMHGHIMASTGPSWVTASPNPEDNLRAYAYAGVTTVFDPGDSSDEAFERRRRVADGELVGPRIYTAGKIITDPEGHPRSVVDALAPAWISWLLKPQVATGVATADEARAAVDERADAGADAIKVVVDSIPLDASIMSEATLRSLVDQAHERGLRAVAHIGTTADAVMAADSGIDLWIHGVYKERIPEDMVAKLVAYDIPMVTTSEVFDRYGRALQGALDPTPLETEMLSQEKIASFYPPPEGFDLGALASWITLMEETRTVRLDNVQRLHKAGVTILAGSDTQSGVFPGAGLHRELATLVAAGLTPAEALRAATLSPARYLSMSTDPDAGIVAVGKRADLILVNGDPTQDITAISDIREVMLNGKLLKRESLNSL
jgi:imidazolonepropionase-like amidohydrolase